MECNRFTEEKVAQSDSPEFRGHRTDCAGCRRDLEEYGEIRALYREASTERYTAGVPRLRRFPRGAWATVAAAVVMVGVLVLILGAPLVNRPSTSVGPAQPGGLSLRLHFNPWDREDAGLNRQLSELRQRLEALEGSLR